MDKSVKTALIIGGVIVAILVILSVVPGLLGGWQGYGSGMMGGGMMGPGMMGGFGIGGGWMGILWIVVLGLIIWGVVSWSQGTAGRSSDLPRGSSPLEILKKRYANGEINKEEYEDKKKDLL